MPPEKMVTENNILAIFAKFPQAGMVKTRLSTEIGCRKVVALYRIFVETIVKNTEDKDFKRILFYAPPAQKKNFSDWLGSEIALHPQKGRELGGRLASAYRFAFAQGAGRVVVIGTDSPLIDRNIIRKAFAKLKNRDCVLGPSRDGGYYLLGLSHPCAEIFEDIEWSTKKVLKQTLKTLNTLNVSYTLLDEHFDVDTRADLIELKHSLRKLRRASSANFDLLLRVVKPL